MSTSSRHPSERPHDIGRGRSPTRRRGDSPLRHERHSKRARSRSRSPPRRDNRDSSRRSRSRSRGRGGFGRKSRSRSRDRSRSPSRRRRGRSRSAERSRSPARRWSRSRSRSRSRSPDRRKSRSRSPQPRNHESRGSSSSSRGRGSGRDREHGGRARSPRPLTAEELAERAWRDAEAAAAAAQAEIERQQAEALAAQRAAAEEYRLSVVAVQQAHDTAQRMEAASREEAQRRRQKQRDDEAKKKKADAEAVDAFAEFFETFAGDSVGSVGDGRPGHLPPPSSTFVRGGTLFPGAAASVAGAAGSETPSSSGDAGEINRSEVPMAFGTTKGAAASAGALGAAGVGAGAELPRAAPSKTATLLASRALESIARGGADGLSAPVPAPVPAATSPGPVAGPTGAATAQPKAVGLGLLLRQRALAAAATSSTSPAPAPASGAAAAAASATSPAGAASSASNPAASSSLPVPPAPTGAVGAALVLGEVLSQQQQQQSLPASLAGAIGPRSLLPAASSSAVAGAAAAAAAAAKRTGGHKDALSGLLAQLDSESSARHRGKDRGSGPADAGAVPLMVSEDGSVAAPLLPPAPFGIAKTKGSFDAGDPHTTNIHVGPLHPSIDEERLVLEFGRFGDIASVKIMWPRTPEEALRGRNSGFISYMERSSGESAIREMSGAKLEGQMITVMFGKRVRLPAKPLVYRKDVLYAIKHGIPLREATRIGLDSDAQDAKAELTQSRSAEKADAGQPASAAAASASMSSSSSSLSSTSEGNAQGGGLFARHSAQVPSADSANGSVIYAIPSGVQRHEVKWPATADAERVISVTAAHVARHGFQLERAIMRREASFVLPVLARRHKRIKALEEEQHSRTALAVGVSDQQSAAKISENALATALEEEARAGGDTARGSSFVFLFDASGSDHLFYRWLVHAISQGDSLEEYRRAPFQIMSGGPFWVPPNPQGRPTAASLKGGGGGAGDGSDDDGIGQEAVQEYLRKTGSSGGDAGGSGFGEGSRRNDKRTKSRGARFDADHFQDLLRNVDTTRASINTVMTFALDNARFAKDITYMLVQSLCVPETPWPRKLARLYCLNDILFNSNADVSQAINYRLAIQENIRGVIASLGETRRAQASRMKEGIITDKVRHLLKLWTSWAFFPLNVTQDLEKLFNGGPAGVDQRG